MFIQNIGKGLPLRIRAIRERGHDFQGLVLAETLSGNVGHRRLNRREQLMQPVSDFVRGCNHEHNKGGLRRKTPFN